MGNADPNAPAGLAELWGAGERGGPKRRNGVPLAGPQFPPLRHRTGETKLPQTPLPVRRAGRPESTVSGDLRILTRATIPSCHLCHPQNVFFFLSPNRLAGKLRVASQPSGSSSTLPYRCCHPPPGPQSSETWGLEVGSDWPALKSQHHPYYETTDRSLLLSIFLPQNVRCYPYNHMV